MTDVTVHEPDNDTTAEQPAPTGRRPHQLLTPLELGLALGAVVSFLIFAMLAPPAQDNVPFSVLATLYLFAGIGGVGLIALRASRWIVESFVRLLAELERRESVRRRQRVEHVKSYLATLVFVATRDAAERARRERAADDVPATGLDGGTARRLLAADNGPVTAEVELISDDMLRGYLMRAVDEQYRHRDDDDGSPNPVA